MITPNQRLGTILALVAFLLLIPYLAMRFTGQPNWSTMDFVLIGVLLLGTGLLCELVLRLVKQFKYRVALCAAILLGLFLVWAELAVGLFGTRFAGS